MNIELQNIQDKIKEDKNICQYTVDEIMYVQRPIGKALYAGRPATGSAAKATDRIKCEICGKEFYRSGRTNHKKTKHHILYEGLNKKLAKILINK